MICCFLCGGSSEWDRVDGRCRLLRRTGVGGEIMDTCSLRISDRDEQRSIEEGSSVVFVCAQEESEVLSSLWIAAFMAAGKENMAVMILGTCRGVEMLTAYLFGDVIHGAVCYEGPGEENV